MIYEVVVGDAVHKSWEVLDVGGCGELSTRSNVVGDPAFEEDRAEFVARGVNGSRVHRCVASNDLETRSQHRLLLPVVNCNVVGEWGRS